MKRSRIISSLLLASSMIAVSFPAAAESVDAFTMRLAAPSSRSTLLLPTSRLMEPGSWEFSALLGYEHRVVRAEVATGDVRGDGVNENVDWISSRSGMLLQGALSPTRRLEILAGLPLLLYQGGVERTDLPRRSVGSAALGDLRLGARVLLMDGAGQEPVGWVLQAGVLAPTGEEHSGISEDRARAQVSTTVGLTEERWDVAGTLGYDTGRSLVIGDQLLGDTLHVGVGGGYHALGVRWMADAVYRHSVAGLTGSAAGRGASLEILAGARYHLGDLHIQAGAGLAPVSNGPTPLVRGLVSIGMGSRFAPDTMEPSICLLMIEQEKAITRAEERAERAALEGSLREAAAELAANRERLEEERARRERLEEERRQGSLESSSFAEEMLRRKAIHFGTGDATLDAEAARDIRRAAVLLLDSGVSATVVGHADDRGSADFNRELSLERAHVVLEALIEAGVERERLDVRAEGIDQPAAPATEFGRAINRRVSFEVRR